MLRSSGGLPQMPDPERPWDILDALFDTPVITGLTLPGFPSRLVVRIIREKSVFAAEDASSSLCF